jgi:cytidylate kinase
MLVAIDGPAGAGKSTIARALAAELGYGYLDSGAMYRCVGLLSLRAPGESAAQLASAAVIELDGARVALDGEDVSEEIRTPAVSSAASRVAADTGVRSALVAKQRTLISSGDWVVEGRDIASVVAPEAQVKVFLTAAPDERARRRAVETGADAAATLAEQEQRDERDSTRAHSPLRAARGAIVLDSTGVSVAEVVASIAALARAAAAAG